MMNTYIFEIFTPVHTKQGGHAVLDTRRFSVLSDGMKWAKARAAQLGTRIVSYRLAGGDPEDNFVVEI
jgi:hypothetical protein